MQYVQPHSDPAPASCSQGRIRTKTTILGVVKRKRPGVGAWVRISPNLRGTGSAAAREESAAGEAGEPSDGGRSCIGASAAGAGGAAASIAAGRCGPTIVD